MEVSGLTLGAFVSASRYRLGSPSVRVEKGDPEHLDFEALAVALRAEGFEVELAGPEEATNRILREDAAGIWQVVQVVLDHVERDAEGIIVGVLTGWAVSKVSRKDDPAPEAKEVRPQANLWLPDGTVKEVPLPVVEDEENKA